MLKNLIFISFVAVFLSACQAAVVAGAGAGGYYIGKDERKFSTIVSDAGITTSVNSKLLTTKGVKTFDIDVDTHNGVVTLNGYVPSEKIRSRIIRLCEETEHVKRCISKLKIGKKTK